MAQQNQQACWCKFSQHIFANGRTKKEVALNRNQMELMIAGHEPPAKRKMNEQVDRRLQKIVGEYNDRNTIDYLHRISYCFTL